MTPASSPSTCNDGAGWLRRPDAISGGIPGQARPAITGQARPAITGEVRLTIASEAGRRGPRARGGGLLHALVKRQPVGKPGDPQCFRVLVARARERKRPAGGRELLPVADDDSQRTG